MKMKELCQKTDLTRKTIMLYEEKGLFTPTKVMQNGRAYREYDDQDVELLHKIALLRKARFTISEIQTMLNHPEELQEIFTLYREAMAVQYQQLTKLVSTLSQIDVNKLDSVDHLIEALTGQVEAMPIPNSDIHPRFRYLDEIEEDRRKYEQEVHRRMNQMRNLDIGKHLVINSATRQNNTNRDLNLNNQQKIAIFRMLDNGDE